MRSANLIAAMALLCHLAPISQAQTTVDPAKLKALSAPTPFQSELAIRRITEAYPAIAGDEETLNFMIEILEYRYDFAAVLGCPYDVVTDCFGQEHFAVYRTIRIPISGLTNAVISEVQRSEKSGCSSLKFPNSGLQVITRTQVIYGGGINAQKFWCDNILGKHKVGSARGNWSLSLPLKGRAPGRILLSKNGQEIEDLGRISIGDAIPWHEINDKKLFGFIDIDTFFGHIFNQLFVEFKLSPLNIVMTWFGESTPEEALENFAKKVEETYSIVNDFADGFGEPTEDYLAFTKTRDPSVVYPFYIDVSRSGFSESTVAGVDLEFKLVQVSYVPASQINFQYTFSFQNEINTIKSWSQNPQTVTVQEQDSLWAISERELGNGQLYHLLSHFNPSLEDTDTLSPGQVITIPLLWQIQLLNRDRSILKQGDTLWDIYIRENPSASWHDWLQGVKGRWNDPSVIYPSMVWTE